jgi:hypothetical protein
MRLLVFSGILYLAGVATVLMLRPSLMFTADGVWKEFGIGKNEETHTWMPFWLFCIGWAILSYLLVVILADVGLIPGTWVSHVEVQQSMSMTKPRNRSASVEEMIPIPRGNKGMKPGYYMLNTEGSGIEGVPKYIYLGPAAPGMD